MEVKMVLAEQVFQCRAKIRLIVAILDDDRRIEAQSPGLGTRDSTLQFSGAWHYHGSFWDYQGLVAGSLEDFAAYDIVDRRAPGQDRARRQYRAPPHQCALVDSGVAADQHIVFNDHWRGIDRLQNPADLRCGTQVH